MFFNARFFLCLVDRLGLMNLRIVSRWHYLFISNGASAKWREAFALRLIREFGLSCSI